MFYFKITGKERFLIRKEKILKIKEVKLKKLIKRFSRRKNLKNTD
jgi:hypothetical protein